MSGFTETAAGELASRIATASASGQAAWLAALREQALDRFRSSGLPTRRVERWKYTSLDLLDQRHPTLDPADPTPVEGVPAPLTDAPRIVLLDGAVNGAEFPDWPEGVQVTPLPRALEDADPALRDLLSGLDLGDDASVMAALNTAALEQGVVIRVAAGVDGGCVLLQWASSAAAGGRLPNGRVCVLLEEGARLELVEQFEGTDGEASQLNTVIQLQLGKASRLRHARMQQLGDEALLVTRTEAGQAESSEYDYVGLDLGGGVVRHDVRARLEAAGARCRLSGATLARGAGHVDNHLDAEHLAPDCASEQWFRAVLEDRSRVVFNGRVHVAVGADGSDAQQSSAALLLSPLAEIDSKPELEIYADEVVASHGATVGQLDEDQLFYLRTRGIPRDEARTLLTAGFCRALVDRWPTESVRDALLQRMQARLADGENGDD